MKTHAELKRLVVGDRRSGNGSVRLMLAEHEGRLYATNSYWLVPADTVRPLLEHNNLPTDKPGVFEVNSKLTMQEIDPPNVGAIIPVHTKADNIEPAWIEGTSKRLLVQIGTNRHAVLFRNGDSVQAFDAAYLEFIEDIGSAPFGFQFIGSVIHRQTDPGKVLGVYIKRQRRETTDAGVKWLDDGEQFLGLLMPVKI